ncbi:PIN domain-containing protein [Mucilaginibacter gynuensis]|uniref:PIN domain-containing protein n=1 Tax=Mucilaginibacter gynuensis TaxID=1302236 RepID=A0ABP8G8J4_9SPHI
MKSIFIDSDILLDALLKREPFDIWAKGVLMLLDNGEYTGCTSVHSLLNTHYIVKKHVGEKAARASIKVLAQKLNILTEDAAVVDQAIASVFSDLEDAVQYYTAVNGRADVIITRNIKDYKNSAIPVLTAEQFLRTL